MVRKLIQKLRKKVLGDRLKAQAVTPPSHQGSGGQERPAGTKKRGRRRRPRERDTAGGWSVDAFQVPEKAGEVRFHDFGLPDPIMHAIHDLGFQYCTPIQGKVFAHARSGANIAGRAQTGTGKTAAFLITIFSQFLADRGRRQQARPGAPRALILAPTRELVLQIAKDAEDLGKYTGFRCMAIYGGMDFDKQRRELGRGPIDLIAATPGRLLDYGRRGDLDLKQVEVLVIDEADRMLDMGFIPDVRRIVRSTPAKDRRQTMLFSATLTDTVLRLASEWATDPVFCEVDPEQVTVDTVKQVIYIVTLRDKFRLLLNLLEQEAMSRVLIFGNRRDSTRRLAAKLGDYGIECAHLSGAVPQEKRLKVLENFKNGKVRVVVATDVAGRGLHVENISHVINYEFPYEPEDYVHRIGRTGRAGIEGTAISFACEAESFVIPEIEEYIGAPLRCTMPDDDLLAPPKHEPRHRSHDEPPRRQPRRGNRPRRRR